LKNRVGAVSTSTVRTRMGGVMGSRLGRGLVLAEATLTTFSVVIVGLMIKSGIERANVPRGLDPDRTYAFGIIPNAERYPDSESRFEVMNRILDEIRALPAVASASFGYMAPSSGFSANYHFVDSADDYPVEESAKKMRRDTISPGYFDIVGISILRGRDFEERDYQLTAVPGYIINREAAERYWPDSDPIGRRMLLNHRTDGIWGEIIGICENEPTMDNQPRVVPYAYRLSSMHTFGIPPASRSQKVRMRLSPARTSNKRPIASIPTQCSTGFPPCGEA